LAFTPDETTARLDGLTVLVARPAAQADTLCRLIEAAGGRAIRLPLFAIAAVADPAEVAAVLAAHRDAARWLFTSTNAVHHAAALCPPPWPALAAVGAVTAAALNRLTGCAVVAPLAGDGAAALLAHPALAEVGGQRLLIVTGEGTLPILGDGLAVSGARVRVLPVYRRVAVEHGPEAVAAAIAAADIALVPSAESLLRLVALTPAAARAALLRLPLALPSPRVLETARSCGFSHEPLLPTRVDDAAWLDTLWRHARQRP
jgi:uroporphyrinogen-III synthase